MKIKREKKWLRWKGESLKENSDLKEKKVIKFREEIGIKMIRKSNKWWKVYLY